jgi:hypothetical protein
MPEVSGRKPRIPIPDSTPLYCTTSTPEFFFRRSVMSAATDRSISFASITSIFCGVSDRRASTRRPVTTSASTRPATSMVRCIGGTAPSGDTSMAVVRGWKSAVAT